MPLLSGPDKSQQRTQPPEPSATIEAAAESADGAVDSLTSSDEQGEQDKEDEGLLDPSQRGRHAVLMERVSNKVEMAKDKSEEALQVLAARTVDLGRGGGVWLRRR